MKFSEWLETRPYSKWEAFKNRNTSQVMWMQDAYEAGIAEERERCANLLESEIKRNDWFAGSAPYEIVLEQIRKGE